MPHRNRVDPLGRIVALDFRGTMMGNRGILHDATGTIVRAHASQAWITCRLQFRGRHREILRPGRWTELFFWDEACALAAGHRPCFECRHTDAVAFRDLFRRVTGQSEARARDIDRRLASERHVGGFEYGCGKVAVMARPEVLPAGVMVWHRGCPHLVTSTGLHPWNGRGYARPVAMPDHEVALLTPVTTTRVIAAGYRPTQVLGSSTAGGHDHA